MAFKGKVAMVTGGGSGMGQAAAWRLADTGAEVVIVDINEEGIKKTAANRPNIHPIVCDTTNFERIQEVVAETEQKYGPIDRLMHAAGVMPDGAMLQEDLAKQKKVFDINFWSTVYFTKTILNKMVERDSGEFVVWGSSAGYYPAPNMSTYCSTKAALNMFMEISAWENRHSKVKIMVVCPGIVKTPLLKQAANMKFTSEQGSKNGATPDQIVLNIEKSLEKDEIICIPDKGAKISLFLRRYFPKIAWKAVLKAEGMT
jgi:short-subunit dehydrogenase